MPQDDKPTSYYDDGRSVSDKAKERLKRLRGGKEKGLYPRKPSEYEIRSGAAIKDRKDQTEKTKKEAW